MELGICAGVMGEDVPLDVQEYEAAHNSGSDKIKHTILADLLFIGASVLSSCNCHAKKRLRP
jgi:hypothetical protein